jgi:dihydrolipoamide dehydrogenase
MWCCGAGPGGYTLHSVPDLGMKVALIERSPTLGGVSERGLHSLQGLVACCQGNRRAHEMAEHGIVFGKPQIDIDKLRGFKNKVIGKLPVD